MTHRQVLINGTSARPFECQTIGATAISTTSSSLPLLPSRSETDSRTACTGINTNLHMAAPLHRAGQRAALDASAHCRTSGLTSRPRQQINRLEANNHRVLAPVAECGLQDYEEMVRHHLRQQQHTTLRQLNGLKPIATPVVGPLRALPPAAAATGHAAIECEQAFCESSIAEACLVLGVHTDTNLPDNTRIDAEDQPASASSASRLSLMKVSPTANGNPLYRKMFEKRQLQPKSVKGSRGAVSFGAPISTAINNQKHPEGSDADANGLCDSGNIAEHVSQPESEHLSSGSRLRILAEGFDSFGTLETAALNRPTQMRTNQFVKKRYANFQTRESDKQSIASDTDTSSVTSDANSALNLQRMSYSSGSMSNLQTGAFSTDAATELSSMVSSNMNGHMGSNVPPAVQQQMLNTRARSQVGRSLETRSLLETSYSRLLLDAECATVCGASGTFAKEAANGEAEQDHQPLDKIPLETRSLLEPLVPLDQHEAPSIALRREYLTVHKTSLLRRRSYRQFVQQKLPELQINKRALQSGRQVGGGTRAKASAAATGEWAISGPVNRDISADTLAEDGGVISTPLDQYRLFGRDEYVRPFNSRNTRNLNGHLKLFFENFTGVK